MPEGPDIGAFIDGRLQRSRQRVDKRLLVPDLASLAWVIGGAWFLAGLPIPFDGDALFDNSPYWLHAGIGGYAVVRGIYVLIRILGIRQRQDIRSAKKTLRDLTGIE